MAEPCWFMLIPSELRLKVYRNLFLNFALQISDDKEFVAYDAQPYLAANQICKVNKTIRLESIPVLASCTNVIAAPLLLPYRDGQVDTTVKPQLVRPHLNRAFRLNIRGLSLSLQSAWVPDHLEFPSLKKIAVDAWLVGEAAVKETKDKDLVKMSKLDIFRLGVPEHIYPQWLESLSREKSHSVKLGLRQVWKVEEEDSEKSHLEALVDVTDGKVEERQLGSKTLEEVDVVPPAWLFG